mmetsp:Transcript_3914/g.9937  ORF Transcript_3914/g.9937 Transcript_3914/m.9937 type:complete len:458 (+) Transcript_3914:204-1577(+)
MPELPEVEHFRQILLPLVDCKGSENRSKKGSGILLECPPPLPTKRFPSQEVIELINRGCYVMTDVLRKGKVLCVILEKRGASPSATKTNQGGQGTRKTNTKLQSKKSSDDDAMIPMTGNEPTLYLSLHMGMTGRISSPNNVPGLESLSGDDAYPPPHTHMILKGSNGKEAAFSDPRRFGSVLVDVCRSSGDVAYEGSIPTFEDIAHDALAASIAYCATEKTSKGAGSDMGQPSIVEQLINRRKGIKGLLLDQRAVVSGVGNWVADEVLYRACIHPDQSFLNMMEAEKIVKELHHVLSMAVTCLVNGDGFPSEWLFHRRWRNGGGGGHAKDFYGKTITFIQSGGRSTALVPSAQKHMSRKSLGQAKKSSITASEKSSGKKKCPDDEQVSKARPKQKAKKRAANTATKPITVGKAANGSSISSISVARGQKRKDLALPRSHTQPTRRSKRRVKNTDFYA